MKPLTNEELIKVQGGGVLTVDYNYLFKRFIKYIVKKLKILAN